MALPMTKPGLRTLILQRLRAMDPGERARKSAEIAAKVIATPPWRSARLIGLFSPLPLEVNLLPAAAGDSRLCFPRVAGERLEFHRMDAAALRPARWNLLEPPEDAPGRVAPEELDLVIVPGLGFTPDGHRLGRGGGYYDRFLATPGLRARLIGVCFSGQVFPLLPTEGHDRPVDQLIYA